MNNALSLFDISRGKYNIWLQLGLAENNLWQSLKIVINILE